MPAATTPSNRRLPDGTRLHNRLLAALPTTDYDRILPYIRMNAVVTGDTLQAHRVRIKDVYFPNGGVFSVTNEMRDGALVEVATVVSEGERVDDAVSVVGVVEPDVGIIAVALVREMCHQLACVAAGSCLDYAGRIDPPCAVHGVSGEV